MNTQRTAFSWPVLIRLALGIALLIWLFRGIPAGDIQTVLTSSLSQWHWWLGGIAFTFAGLTAAALRWAILLAAQDLSIPFARVFRIFYIGQFFNAFLPGSCGGDVARAYYTLREAPDRKTEAVSTVLADRAIGLLAIILFSCLLLASRFTWMLSFRPLTWAGGFMFAILAAALVLLLLVFRLDLFERYPIFRRLETRFRIGPLVHKLYNAFYVYRKRPRTLILAALLSFLNLAGLTLACYAFGRSLNLSIALIDYFTLFPIITTLSAIPLTPGALGVRENLFAELFVITGARAAQTVPLSLLVYLGGVCWSVFGGLLFIGHSAQGGVGWRAEWQRFKSHTLSADSNPF